MFGKKFKKEYIKYKKGDLCARKIAINRYQAIS